MINFSMKLLDEKTLSGPIVSGSVVGRLSGPIVSGNVVGRLALNSEVNPREIVYKEGQNRINPITGRSYFQERERSRLPHEGFIGFFMPTIPETDTDEFGLNMVLGRMDVRDEKIPMSVYNEFAEEFYTTLRSSMEYTGADKKFYR